MLTVHACNWDKFMSSLRAMLPSLMGYNNNQYGRWLPDFWAMLASLPVDQVTFLHSNFTQSITGHPYSNMAWDMWIECTMKKGSKMKSDGYLLQKILVHSRNVNNVAQIGATHNALASQTHNKWKHTDFGQNRLRQDEQYVQDLIACMHEFDSFPFNPTSPTLRTLQSTMPASSQLVADFNSVHAAGEMKLASFLKE